MKISRTHHVTKRGRVKKNPVRCTRKDYMDGKCSHEDYYGQFVDENIKSTLLRYISKERILKSRDEHLNDIPLKLWDALPLLSETANKLREKGDYPTLAGKVCIYKVAARQIKEGR